MEDDKFGHVGYKVFDWVEHNNRKDRVQDLLDLVKKYPMCSAEEAAEIFYEGGAGFDETSYQRSLIAATATMEDFLDGLCDSGLLSKRKMKGTARYRLI